MPPPKLTPEQQYIFDLIVRDGESVFFTGAAGTGKSFLLRRIISALQRRYGKRSIGVTASTGIAACYIGSTTLRSWAGVGLGDVPKERILWRAKRNRLSSLRWAECCVLIIDVVSMISADL